MWSNYLAIGHERLIYTNTASVLPGVVERLTAAIGGNPRVHGVLLTATDHAVQERLAQREVGGGLAEHLERSRRMNEKLDVALPWVHRLPTDDRTVVEVAAEIARLLSWSARG
jgi:hypothetical protein